MFPGQILCLRLGFSRKRCAGLCTLLLAGGVLAGCANPGPPSAPSLKLPRVVADLTAERVGSTVTLHWTMPRDTTDGLALRGSFETAICRSEGAGTCQPVQKLRENAGAAATFADPLTVALASGPERLLGYRVTVLNAKKRSAGMSAEAFVPGGASIAAPVEVSAIATSRGVLLRWKPLAAEPVATEVLVLRDLIAPAASVTPAGSAATAGSGRKGGTAPAIGRGSFGSSAKETEPATQTLRIRLQAGDGAGTTGAGTAAATNDRALDATARFGSTYRYTLQAVAEEKLQGHVARNLSPPSNAVTLRPMDTFPPAAPRGLEVVLSGGGPPAQPPDVDLSWEPNTEPDLAGYLVYRRDAGAADSQPHRINPGALTAAPSFQDDHVEAGGRYLYSISAVDEAGNASQRSAEQEQDIPAQ